MNSTADEAFELIEDALGRLALRRVGQEDVQDVRLRRSFPWTRPGKFISIRSSEGKEILLIEDLSKLAPDLKAAIERWLTSTSFIPRITKVEEVDLRFGFQEWTVQTDRGPAKFRVQEREDVRFLGDGRFRIKDADGNIYELSNLLSMDPRSQKQLEALF